VTPRRVFAHVERLTIACPQCGGIYLLGWGRQSPAWGTGPTGQAYDPETGVFHCQRRSCHYRAFVGVTLYPAHQQQKRVLPADHVPSPREAAAMRLHVEGEPMPGTRARINKLCTCGPCPVHPREVPHDRQD